MNAFTGALLIIGLITVLTTAPPTAFAACPTLPTAVLYAPPTFLARPPKSGASLIVCSMFSINRCSCKCSIPSIITLVSFICLLYHSNITNTATFSPTCSTKASKSSPTSSDSTFFHSGCTKLWVKLSATSPPTSSVLALAIASFINLANSSGDFGSLNIERCPPELCMTLPSAPTTVSPASCISSVNSAGSFINFSEYA